MPVTLYSREGKSILALDKTAREQLGNPERVWVSIDMERDSSKTSKVVKDVYVEVNELYGSDELHGAGIAKDKRVFEVWGPALTDRAVLRITPVPRDNKFGGVQIDRRGILSAQRDILHLKVPFGKYYCQVEKIESNQLVITAFYKDVIK